MHSTINSRKSKKSFLGFLSYGCLMDIDDYLPDAYFNFFITLYCVPLLGISLPFFFHMSLHLRKSWQSAQTIKIITLSPPRFASVPSAVAYDLMGNHFDPEFILSIKTIQESSSPASTLDSYGWIAETRYDINEAFDAWNIILIILKFIPQ